MWLLLLGLSWAGEGLLALPPADIRIGAVPHDPEVVRALGEATLLGVERQVRRYGFVLPVRPRVMFLSSRPPGMDVTLRGRKLSFNLDDAAPNSWAYSAKGLIVRVGPQSPRPSAADIVVTWPDGSDRQVTLDTWDASPANSVVRSLQVGATTRRGLLLPAPSEIAWQVDVPEGAELRFGVGIVPPELLAGVPSDGADLIVYVNGTERARLRIDPIRFMDHRLSLGTEAGTTARITLSVADPNPTLDYAFVTEPRVIVPTDRPQRVVLLFIDTLRRDHLGTYGYARRPSPAIDAWASTAVVMEDARTIAPWTLPSTRTMLTGNHPEDWSASTKLPELLAARGWVSGAFVGNIYLTGAFDMAQAWGEHHAYNLPYADYQVARGLDFLARHPDEDVVMMLHFMDLHLPYKELWPYRWQYVESELDGLHEGFNRNALLRYARSKREQDDARRYLIDRYDQNLAAVDDALSRLFPVLGNDAVTVLFADHGEEFFDHGDLEHGHTLYDELLRVPLIVSAPGLAPRRVDARASLLDVTPTVLQLLDREPPETDGFSLVPLARGETDARFADRPLDFGRLLYGDNAWGSLRGGHKWVARGGSTTSWDVHADPLEANPLRQVDDGTGRTALSDALGVPVVAALRLTPESGKNSGNVRLRVPEGMSAAWAGDEPTRHAEVTWELNADATELVAQFKTTGAAQRELFVLPKGSLAGAVLSLDRNEGQNLINRPSDAGTAPLAKVKRSGVSVTATWAWVPLPFGDELDGFDAESAEALKQLGYLDDGRGP